MMLGGPVLAAGDHLGCLRRAQRAARRGGIPRGRPGDGEPSTRQPRRTSPPPSCTAPTNPTKHPGRRRRGPLPALTSSRRAERRLRDTHTSRDRSA